MKKITSISFGLLVIVCLVTLTAGQAAAEVLASSSRANSFIRTAPSANANVNLPLNNAGTTSLVFYTNQPNQKVIVSFNAECAVRSTTNVFTNYLEIDTFIDGVILSPTNDGGTALCTGHGNNTLANWTSVVSIAERIVPNPGLHRVVVRVNGVGLSSAGEGWRIDDSSTVVWK